MIRVTVELIPKGKGEPKHLGTAEIWNLGDGSPARGNYKYVLSQRGRPNVEFRSGLITDFPRKRFLMWDLLYRILWHAVGDRNA